MLHKISKGPLKNNIILLGITMLFISCNDNVEEYIGNTIITKWPNDKTSALSITYDDGIINQMTVARPIMNKLGLPGTFYIITGKVKGSGKGQFIGRVAEEIIRETAIHRTDRENFYERASLIAHTGTSEAIEYHSNSGSLFESGKITEAYELIDEGFQKLRNGQLKNTNDVVFHNNAIDTTTWEDYKKYTLEGHEIASHTVTHARLAVLNEENLIYELRQSKDDISKYLGEKYTFSAECPYGTENERVMEYAHKIYPALRNRMPETYLDELNRSSERDPGDSEMEYVQWQRGPRTKTSMKEMKSWVDISLSHNNIWLVLVFHGVDGVGWESKTGAELEHYFNYINEKKDSLWVATFADVTKYIRARKNTMLSAEIDGGKIKVKIRQNLDPEVYDIPLTLKTYIPEKWKTVVLSKKTEGEKHLKLKIRNDELGAYVLYPIFSNENEIVLQK